MAAHCDLLLLERQRLSRRYAQLPLHQVKSGDHLRDRMLHLQARVHFHEVQTALAIQQKLDRARAHVIHRARRAAAGFGERLAQIFGKQRRRSLFDDFLMTALHAAIALEDADDVAVGISEDLHLNVARLDQVLFQQHGIVAERGCSLALAAGQRSSKLLRRIDTAHALAAAARIGLDHHRIADRIRLLLQELRAIDPRHRIPA